MAGAEPNAGHCVIYVDIDRLHVLNENHGMHVGDEAIARLADTLRRSMAPRMLAARISGDRFAVFIGDCSLRSATQLSETLRDGISPLGHVVDGRHLDISASFGVASVTAAKNPLAYALAAAEIACKAAKDRGRGRVEAYEDAMLVGTLREALANNLFRLEAQPLVAFADGRHGRRFELLVRKGINWPRTSIDGSSSTYSKPWPRKQSDLRLSEPILLSTSPAGRLATMIFPRSWRGNCARTGCRRH